MRKRLSMTDTNENRQLSLPVLSVCRRTLFSFQNVGAITDRPPKNAVFRIFRGKIPMFSPCGDGFCGSKIHGRSMIAPTGQHNASSPSKLASVNAIWE
jgi:hypothetical protein